MEPVTQVGAAFGLVIVANIVIKWVTAQFNWLFKDRKLEKEEREKYMELLANHLESSNKTILDVSTIMGDAVKASAETTAKSIKESASTTAKSIDGMSEALTALRISFAEQFGHNND